MTSSKPGRTSSPDTTGGSLRTSTCEECHVNDEKADAHLDTVTQDPQERLVPLLQDRGQVGVVGLKRAVAFVAGRGEVDEGLPFLSGHL